MTVTHLALLGTWHVHAAHHVEDARNNGATDLAVMWDSDEGRGREFAARHGLRFEPQLDTILNDPEIDGVVIDSSTTDHRDLIGRALAAGKHVFSEKVLAATPEDARALAAAALKAGRVLHVSFQRLIDPVFQTVLAVIARGDIGEVTGSRIRYAHNGAVGIPWIPEHFFDPEQTGGGAIIDLGAHPIYLSMALHGAFPGSVSAEMQFVSGRRIEDNAAFILSYDGALSSAEVSMVGSSLGHSIEVSGTEGTIVVGPVDERVLVRRGNDSWQPAELAAGLPDTFDAFVASVLDPDSADYDRTHLELAVRVTDVIDGAYRSARTGVRVSLDEFTI